METQDYQNQLLNINEWIKVADQKISILIAVIAGLTGLFKEQLIGLFTNSQSLENPFYTITLVAWIVTLSWMLGKLLFALSPKIKNLGKSPLFFGSIAKKSRKSFTSSIKKIDTIRYEDALIEQIHTNSVIASTKHGLLSDSIKIFLSNTALLMILVVIRLID